MSATLVTVTGSFTKPGGLPAQGRITAVCSRPLVNGAEHIDNTPVVGRLDSTGSLVAPAGGPFLLAATDDDVTDPTGAFYTWTIQLDSAPIRAFTAPLPHVPSTTDLTALEGGEMNAEEVQAMIDASLPQPVNVMLPGNRVDKRWQDVVLPARTSYVRFGCSDIDGPAQVATIQLAEEPPDGWLLRLLWDTPAGLTLKQAEDLAKAYTGGTGESDTPFPSMREGANLLAGQPNQAEREYHAKELKSLEETLAKGEMTQEAFDEAAFEHYPWGVPPESLGAGRIIYANIRITQVWTLVSNGKLMWEAKHRFWIMKY
jgi:hypothetical protein